MGAVEVESAMETKVRFAPPLGLRPADSVQIPKNHFRATGVEFESQP